MTELTKEQVDAIAEYLKECHMDDMDADDMVFSLRKAWAERDSYKRKADALDKLDSVLEANKQIHVCINRDSILNIVVVWGDEFGATAPNLLEAIEKAQVSK